MIYALGLGTWKVWHPNQSCSKVAPKAKFLARLGEKNGCMSRSKLKQAFLVDSDAEIFMNLIQCIRLMKSSASELGLSSVNLKLTANRAYILFVTAITM